MKCYVDFETASSVDLLKVGAYNYAKHPSTEILCAVFIREDGKELIWNRYHMQPSPFWWCQFFEEISMYVAHNAFFEQVIWKFVWGHCPDHNKWRCTRAKGLSHGLPSSLEKLADSLHLLQQKDMEGVKVMKLCCTKPEIDLEKWEQILLENYDRLIKYCRQDVLTTIEIDKAIPDLSEDEQKVWELDQEINFRGVQLDIPLIQELISLLDCEKKELEHEFNILVDGRVSSVRSSVKLREFLSDKLGVVLESVDKNTITELKQSCDDATVSRILEIRRILSKSSTAKLSKMLDLCDEEGVLRENLVYHGASTGRWSGYGVQLQNLARPKLDAEIALEELPIADIAWPTYYGSIAETASSLLRSTLIPSKGKIFIGGDYSGIEARVLAWISGQTDKIEIFKNDEDIYCYAATGIYGKTITKEDKNERQTGKTAELGLGYQGGISAFNTMCMAYNISLAPIADSIIKSASARELDSANFCYNLYIQKCQQNATKPLPKIEGICADIIKQRWRIKNNKIVEFWHAIERKAIEAVLGISTRQNFTNLRFYLEDVFLYCELPSGRRIAYYKPEIKEQANGKQYLTYVGMDSTTKQMRREPTYGGKITENIVQAIARDIMVQGMFNVKNYGLDLVLTVHDEILSESDQVSDAENLKKAVRECFIKMPKWANGLPLNAEVWTGDRYQK